VPRTTLSSRSKVATGINVFTLPPERQTALFDTLDAINHEILTNKFPMNISSNFHRGIDASIVINYNQYTDRASGQYLRTRPETAPLLKRSHDLCDKHEIRWYEVAEIVTADGVSADMEIAASPGTAAVIGIFTIQPERQSDFLALLARYGQTLKSAEAPGFAGIAIHRGYQGAHVASYEQWTSADAYRQALQHAPTAGLVDQIRETADVTELHIYDVVRVTRFDLD
jgi:heme-degrading monooxygenase HmoA